MHLPRGTGGPDRYTHPPREENDPDRYTHTPRSTVYETLFGEVDAARMLFGTVPRSMTGVLVIAEAAD